ncbi:MAG: redox-sensitive bicupin YhaK (pirin superfamily) [Sulfurimonas sp.]|jgi:redox-sensitive bicupin YhaK (pirin superfamily)|uniref:pirin family protein n=1 Tax=Sulfurimonas sp. TaxID=2022749 RepID=UPI0039E4F041
MFKKLPKENMGSSNLGWLESRFHFSFAEYRNYENMNFGVMRVLNDDIIHPSSGFDMHPHNDMEIISYIVDGEITHKDSMGNSEVLKRGEVQYMSAGSGIVHAEHNESTSKDLRLLQIWIVPPEKNLQVLYGSHMYTKDQRDNKLLNIVSSQEGNAEVKLYQDVNIYVSELEKGKDLEFPIEVRRQVYFIQVEGSSSVNGVTLDDGDAMEIIQERSLDIKALQNSHFLFIEMLES